MTPLGDDPTAANPIEAFAGLVEEETGRAVEIVDVPDDTAVVEAIRNYHADIGFMSAFPSALAVNTGGVDGLVAWPGSDEPVSTCLVLDDSPLQSLEDITPETVVAFADPASSSLPDLVFALMFVSAVGLGPFAGILAMTIGSIGSIGKVFAEATDRRSPRRQLPPGAQ